MILSASKNSSSSSSVENPSALKNFFLSAKVTPPYGKKKSSKMEDSLIDK
jgi:hypothetical protein